MDRSTEVYDTRINGQEFTFMVFYSEAGYWAAYAYKGRPGSVPYYEHAEGASSESAALNLVKLLEK